MTELDSPARKILYGSEPEVVEGANEIIDAPTVTTAVGTFKVNSSTGGVVAATNLAGNATHTPNAIGLTSSGTVTAGQGATLQGGGGSGYVLASSDSRQQHPPSRQSWHMCQLRSHCRRRPRTGRLRSRRRPIPSRQRFRRC
jgi:hypothetical protein